MQLEHYKIHTLVFDPTTLDVLSVIPDVTTAYDVNELLLQGGGSICASLDLAGASIKVKDCTLEECTTPVVNNVVVIEAKCGEATGQATIEMSSTNDYNYTWSPNVSTHQYSQ